MAARPKRRGGVKTCRIVCWKANGLRSKKLELEHFPNHHVVEICLLSEIILKPFQAFHRTSRLTAGGGETIVVRRGIVHHSVPLYRPHPLGGYCHSVHNGQQTGEKPCGLLFSFPPLIGADLTACFGGGLPVVMAGDLNDKHVYWNSRLSTRRGNLLRDYADENSCMIFGPNTPNTNPYNTCAIPDILDIVISQNLSSPVHLTWCTSLTSDHLQVLVDTARHSSFHHPTHRSDFRRSDWANFETYLEDKIPFDPELHNEMIIDTCFEKISVAILKAIAASAPKSRPRDDARIPIPAGIQDEIRLKYRLRRRWQVTRNRALRAESTAFRVR